MLCSAASIWEIVIKRGLGREDFKVDPRRLRKILIVHGYTELPVTAEHTELSQDPEKLPKVYTELSQDPEKLPKVYAERLV